MIKPLVCLAGLLLLLPKATLAYEASEVEPQELIVKFKQGQTPEELKKVLEQRLHAKQAFEILKYHLEDTADKLQGEKTINEQINELEKIEDTAGVVEQNKLIETDDPALSRLYLIKIKKSLSVKDLENFYDSLSMVEYAEPNYIFQAEESLNQSGPIKPDDPMFKDQWNLKKIQVDRAWQITKGSKEVRIAVLDSGTDYGHPDLPKDIIKGKDFVNPNTGQSEYESAHGTTVAGVIGAIPNNKIGISGIVWDAQMISIKVCNSVSQCTYAAITGGIVDAADRRARVINISIAGVFANPDDVRALKEAIEYAKKRGVVIVVAAANKNGDIHETVPASLPGVIPVAATTIDDQKTPYSNYGSKIKLAAPAGDWEANPIPALTVAGYKVSTGTSVAAPQVAAAAALLFSKYPTLTPEQVEQLLFDGADQIKTDKPIGKRLNIYRSLMLAAGMKIPSGEYFDAAERVCMGILNKKTVSQSCLDKATEKCLKGSLNEADIPSCLANFQVKLAKFNQYGIAVDDVVIDPDTKKVLNIESGQLFYYPNGTQQGLYYVTKEQNFLPVKTSSPQDNQGVVFNSFGIATSNIKIDPNAAKVINLEPGYLFLNDSEVYYVFPDKSFWGLKATVSRLWPPLTSLASSQKKPPVVQALAIKQGESVLLSARILDTDQPNVFCPNKTLTFSLTKLADNPDDNPVEVFRQEKVGTCTNLVVKVDQPGNYLFKAELVSENQDIPEVVGTVTIKILAQTYNETQTTIEITTDNTDQTGLQPFKKQFLANQRFDLVALFPKNKKIAGVSVQKQNDYYLLEKIEDSPSVFNVRPCVRSVKYQVIIPDFVGLSVRAIKRDQTSDLLTNQQYMSCGEGISLDYDDLVNKGYVALQISAAYLPNPSLNRTKSQADAKVVLNGDYQSTDGNDGEDNYLSISSFPETISSFDQQFQIIVLSSQPLVNPNLNLTKDGQIFSISPIESSEGCRDKVGDCKYSFNIDNNAKHYLAQICFNNLCKELDLQIDMQPEDDNRSALTQTVDVKIIVVRKVKEIDLVLIGDEENKITLYTAEAGYLNPEIELKNDLNLYKIVTIFNDETQEEDSSFYIEKTDLVPADEPAALIEPIPEETEPQLPAEDEQ